MEVKQTFPHVHSAHGRTAVCSRVENFREKETHLISPGSTTLFLIHLFFNECPFCRIILTEVPYCSENSPAGYIENLLICYSKCESRLKVYRKSFET